jgi:hypothetical protein
MHVNPWAVVTAAVAAFLVGGVWYSPIAFARPWMAVTGLTEEGIKARKDAGRVFGGSFALTLVASANLAFFLGGADTTIAWGATAGALAAVWVVAGLGVIYLFERRPLRHFFVNAGYQAVVFPLMGLILGAWR